MSKRTVWGSLEAKCNYQERKKNLVMQLVYTDPLRWREVKKELPTRETPYAGKFGVTIMGFDLDEYLDSGSCHPMDLVFDFKSKKFEALCTDGSFIQVGITHWLPMPPIPARQKATVKPASTALGIYGGGPFARVLLGKVNNAKKVTKTTKNKEL